jgi:hypothetical protein
MKEKTATARMGSFSSQSFLFFLLLYPAANVAGVFVPLKRVEWAGGSVQTIYGMVWPTAI